MVAHTALEHTDSQSCHQADSSRTCAQLPFDFALFHIGHGSTAYRRLQASVRRQQKLRGIAAMSYKCTMDSADCSRAGALGGQQRQLSTLPNAANRK